MDRVPGQPGFQGFPLCQGSEAPTLTSGSLGPRLRNICGHIPALCQGETWLCVELPAQPWLELSEHHHGCKVEKWVEPGRFDSVKKPVSKFRGPAPHPGCCCLLSPVQQPSCWPQGELQAPGILQPRHEKGFHTGTPTIREMGRSSFEFQLFPLASG